MKKYIIILLMLVYGLPSTGASLHLHFCCGKLDAVSFSVEHKPGCTKQGADNKVCCNNVALDLKIEADQALANKVIPVLNFTPALTSEFFTWEEMVPVKVVYAANNAHAPPLHSLLPVYLKNCVFRI